MALEDYIAVKTKSAVYVPHTAGRYQKKRFRKAQCPIVERCAAACSTARPLGPLHGDGLAPQPLAPQPLQGSRFLFVCAPQAGGVPDDARPQQWQEADGGACFLGPAVRGAQRRSPATLQQQIGTQQRSESLL
jgi:hypothetical protein